MNIMLTITPFKVSLMLSARIYAEKFCRQQNNPKKAKQVYLNSLAVSAVEFYLNSLGWQTNREKSDSWNPVMQTLMDVADLDVPDFGKIECRVLFDEQELIVPSEVQSNRIAYVLVKFGSSLQECELLGFIPELTNGSISLNQLHPIGNLTSHLRACKQLQDKKNNQSIINLSEWWQGIFDDSWQVLEKIFPQEPNLSFRSFNNLQELSKIDKLSQGISRVKLLDLGKDYNRIPIALILQLVTGDTKEIDVSAKICPVNTSIYLPQGLEIMVLDGSQKPVLQAKAHKTNENIEFLFSGEPGEIFSIKASLKENNIVETFRI